MSGQWSQTVSDSLIAQLEELSSATDAFAALVAKPPLIFEDASQALVFLTTRLVRSFLISF